MSTENLQSDKPVGLMKEFFDYYTESGFGSKLKSDIDVQVFKMFIENAGSFGFKGNTNIFTLTKSDINSLSIFLRTSQSKVVGFIERYKLINDKNLDNNKFIEIIKEQLNNYQNANLINGDKFRLYIPNKILRDYVEVKLSEIRFIPDYSFNRDILEVDWLSIIYLLDISSEEFFELVKEDFINEDEKYKEFIELYKNESIGSILVKVGSNVLEDRFGIPAELTENLTNKVINYIRRKLK